MDTRKPGGRHVAAQEAEAAVGLVVEVVEIAADVARRPVPAGDEIGGMVVRQVVHEAAALDVLSHVQIVAFHLVRDALELPGGIRYRRPEAGGLHVAEGLRRERGDTAAQRKAEDSDAFLVHAAGGAEHLQGVALEETAVDQQALAIVLDQVLGAGDGTGAAEKSAC